ncbi:MAG: CPBP family intramembrane glutamic endopeptidase [Planctomycetota bacterium]
MSRRQLYVLVPCFYTLMALAAVAWRRLAHLPLDARLWFAGCEPGAAVILGTAAAGVVLLVTELALHRRGWVDFLERSFRELLGRVTVLRALWLALLSSAGEELLFRGAMQPTLGITAATVVFGLLHSGPDRRFLIWTGFALAMGFLLGWLYDRTGGVLAPMLTHFLVNFHNLLDEDRVAMPPPWMRSRWDRAG